MLLAPYTGLYLVSPQGEILATSGEGRILWASYRVNLKAIQAAQAYDPMMPVFAEDPDAPGETRIVALRPLSDRGDGWLMVVSRSADLLTRTSEVVKSYALRTGAKAALLTLAMIPIKNAGIYLYRLVSFVLYELLRRPALLEAATAEADAAFAGGQPTLEHVRGMRTLQGVILEALRLHPMALALPRVVREGFEFGGFRFRPGETVYIAGPVTHFDPAVFPDPDAFDPERWERIHPSPYQYSPFSAGPRTCIGAMFAQLEMKIVLALLLQRFRLELASSRIDRFAEMVLCTKQPLLMRVQSADGRFANSARPFAGNVHEMVEFPRQTPARSA